MADIIYKNSSDVKWNFAFDSYMVQSVVTSGTETGAGLIIGSGETLTSTSIITTTTDALLAFGVNELLASSEIATSQTPAATLTLGIVEDLSSSSSSSTWDKIFGYLNTGHAERLKYSGIITTDVTSSLDLGIVEIISSTILTSSVIAGPLLTTGGTEFVKSLVIINSNVNGLLDLGLFELLASTTISAATSDAWLQMGHLESLSADTHCVLAETSKVLTLGSETPCVTTSLISSTSVANLDLGVTETTAATILNASVSDANLTLGRFEPLNHSIFPISLDGLYDQINLKTGSATQQNAEYEVPGHPLENLFNDSELTWKTSDIGPIILWDCGENNKALVTKFSITINDRTDIPLLINIYGSENEFDGWYYENDDWDNLLSYHRNDWPEKEKVTIDLISTKEYRYYYIILEGFTYFCDLVNIELLGPENPASKFIKSSTSSDLILGIETELSSFISYNTISSDSTLALGVIEASGATGSIISNVINSELTLGLETQLLASTHTESIFSSYLNIGTTEVLSGSVYNNSSVGAQLIIGRVEVLGAAKTSTSFIISNLILGRPEILAATSTINSNVDVTMILGIQELLVTQELVQSIVSAEITMGADTELSATSTIDVNCVAITLNLGITESLSASINFSSSIISVLMIGVTELLASTIINTASSDAGLYVGSSEFLTSTGCLIISRVVSDSIILGTIEVLESTVECITESNLAPLLSGSEEIMTGTSSTSSKTISWIIIGQPELMTSTSVIISKFSSSLILGKAEDLSSTSHVISNDISLLTLGIIELLTDTEVPISSSASASITLGVDEELSSTINLSTYSYGLVDTGIDELAASSSSTTSSTLAFLILGHAEPLSSSIIINSIDNGDIYLGRIEPLSDECVCWVSVFGQLTNGLVEVLSSVSISNSVTDADLTLGRLETLNHTVEPGFNMVNYVNPTTGVALGDSYSEGFPPENAFDGNLETSWKSAPYIPGPYYEHEFIWDFGENNKQIIIQHSVTNGFVGYSIRRNRIFGSNDNINWTLVSSHSTYEYDDDFETHIFDEFYNKTAYRYYKLSISPLATFIEITNIELLGYSKNVFAETSTSSDLILGLVEPLSATRETVSTVSNSLLSSGVVEIISSSTFSVSITEADLTIGKVEELSTSINATNSISSFISFGNDEILSVTSGITLINTSATAILGFGVSEFMGTSFIRPVVNASVYADLILGHVEELSHGYVDPIDSGDQIPDIKSSILSTLSFGIVENTSVSTSYTSSTAAELTIGHIEELSSTILAESNIENIITLGGPVNLYGSLNILTYGSSEPLILGVSELLATTIISASILDASISFGEFEILTGTSIIYSNPVAFINLGVVEDLKASTGPIAFVLADVGFGIIEMIKASSTINSSANSNMFIGGIEMISSTVNITTTDASLLSIGVFEVLATTGPIVSNCIATISTGAAESLSHKLVEFTLGSVNLIDPEIGSEYSNTWVSGYPPENAFDNNPTTKWVGDYTDAYYLLQWDFGVGNGRVVKQFSVTCGEAIYAPSKITLLGKESVYTINNFIQGFSNLVWTDNETKVFDVLVDTINYRYHHLILNKASGQQRMEIVDIKLFGYGETINVLKDFAKSSSISNLTLGIETPISSTISFGSAAVASLSIGVVEILASTTFSVSLAEGISVSFGAEEPLSSTASISFSDTVGDLGIYGVIEELFGTTGVFSNSISNVLNTGVVELLTTFKTIWTQIPTPELTIGGYEYLSGESYSSSNVYSSETLIIGIIELLTSSIFSITITDSTLTLGVGEYLSAIIDINSNIEAIITAGDTELLAATIISTGATAGELVFGVAEFLGTANITTTSATAQIFAGINEIQNGTSFITSDVSIVSMSRLVSLTHIRIGVSSKGSIFKVL